MSDASDSHAGGVQKRMLPAFIVLSLLISWLFWSPLLASAAGLVSFKVEITDLLGFILYIAAMTSMWIAAIPLIVRAGGFGAVTGRLKSLLDLKKNALVYLFAILAPVAIEVVAPGIFATAAGKPVPSFDLPYILFLLVLGVHVAVVLALAGIGFAMPLFGDGHSRVASAAIAGVFTLIWLIPMCLNTVLHYPGYGILWYIVGFVPVAALVLLVYYASK